MEKAKVMDATPARKGLRERFEYKWIALGVTLGSQPMQAFVVGMHSAFLVSIVLSVLAAPLSWVRGKENRHEQARSMATGE